MQAGPDDPDGEYWGGFVFDCQDFIVIPRNMFYAKWSVDDEA